MKNIKNILIAVLVVIIGVLWFRPDPKPIITQLDPITKVIEVPVDKLTTKTVTKYVPVEDRTAVEALMAKNKALEAKVQELTVSLAQSQSTGSGPVTVTPAPTPEAPEKSILTFKDWRLNFTSDGTTANYTLTQQFSIVNSSGVNKNNVPVNVVQLYEIGPNNERTLIPTVQTTTIAAQSNPKHWYRKTSVQLGAAVMLPEKDGASAQHGVLVATPWLKRGTIESAEHSTLALLTPAVIVKGDATAIGVLPISLNLGSVIKSPLKDVWISPFVGKTVKGGLTKFGISFTATF